MILRSQLKSIKHFVILLAMFTAAEFVVASSPANDNPDSGARPNIVIIFNDDQGYQDLGCYGSPDIKTPRVDQLAAQGMKFTDFYVAANVCSPSRAALLTGCYPYRVGVSKVFFPNQPFYPGLDPRHVTIAEVLKKVGYATKAVGKWHLGDGVKYLPTNQGFDSYFGIPYSNDMYPSLTMEYAEDCVFRNGESIQSIEATFAKEKEMKTGRRNPRALHSHVPLMIDQECIEYPCDQSTLTRRYADESISFIEASVAAKEPFFLYLANSMPHTPLYASEDFEGKSARGLYGDVIEEIDFNTGRVLDSLREQGVERNTIVVFSSDNGPWLIKGDHGGSALPLFEGKTTCFEGGQRVPAIVRWPEKIAAGATCSEMLTAMDLLPTLANVVGAEIEPAMPIDGKDVLDLWVSKEGATTPHEYFFYEHQAVRSGDWKYHREELFVHKKTKRDSTGPTLYKLNTDVGETQNVIEQHPEIAQRLRLALEDHIANTPEPANGKRRRQRAKKKK